MNIAMSLQTKGTSRTSREWKRVNLHVTPWETIDFQSVRARKFSENLPYCNWKQLFDTWEILIWLFNIKVNRDARCRNKRFEAHNVFPINQKLDVQVSVWENQIEKMSNVREVFYLTKRVWLCFSSKTQAVCSVICGYERLHKTYMCNKYLWKSWI